MKKVDPSDPSSESCIPAYMHRETCELSWERPTPEAEVEGSAVGGGSHGAGDGSGGGGADRAPPSEAAKNAEAAAAAAEAADAAAQAAVAEGHRVLLEMAGRIEVGQAQPCASPARCLLSSPSRPRCPPLRLHACTPP